MSKEKKNKNVYFNKDTQKAIYDFLNSNDKKEKEKLYITYIMPAFDKLVENLININKFSSYDESYEDLKNDCITFLFESLNKFDFSRGTNAFSYFNVVAKNWLIIKSKQKQNRIKNIISLDEDENGNINQSIQPVESLSLEANLTIYQDKIEKENYEDKEKLMDMLTIIKSMSKTKNEINCINSILSIFENVDSIDLLNKNAVFLYLREISGLNPKQLTLTIQSLKKYYKKVNKRENE